MQVPTNHDPKHAGTAALGGEPTWRRVVNQQYTTDQSPRLSIFDLLILTSFCGLAIAIIRQLSALGAVILFVACVMATVTSMLKLQCPAKLRFWNQVIWGILMPLICIFSDRFVFGTFSNGEAQNLYRFALASYAFIGVQMLLLISSWFITQEFVKKMLGSGLMAGAVFALAIGLTLLPFTVLGFSVSIIAIIGLTPLLTASTYYQTGMMLLGTTKPETKMWLNWFFLSMTFLMILLLPILRIWTTWSL